MTDISWDDRVENNGATEPGRVSAGVMNAIKGAVNAKANRTEVRDMVTIRATAALFVSGDAFPGAPTTLLAGQWGYETDTGKTKVGDGESAWDDLPYTSASLSVGDARAAVTIRATAALFASGDAFGDEDTLLASQWGYETDTGKVKVGDGETAWDELPYANEPEALTADVLASVLEDARTAGGEAYDGLAGEIGQAAEASSVMLGIATKENLWAASAGALVVIPSVLEQAYRWQTLSYDADLDEVDIDGGAFFNGKVTISGSAAFVGLSGLNGVARKVVVTASADGCEITVPGADVSWGFGEGLVLDEDERVMLLFEADGVVVHVTVGPAAD